MNMQNKKPNRFKKWLTARKFATALLASALIVGVIGFLNHQGYITFEESIAQIISDFYANIATEMASIAITVLVIDQLNEWRAEEQLKSQLIREMGSPDNWTALRAVDELRAHRWLFDGSLQGENFSHANLKRANLFNADLSRVNLEGADLENTDLRGEMGVNLQGANLSFANLKDSRMQKANLQFADLTCAKLEGADLSFANLKGAKTDFGEPDLSTVKSLRGATLPNGSRYESQGSSSY